MKIDRIIAPEKNSQSLIVHAHIGYQCIGHIAQIQFPTFSDPGEAAVNPDAESGIVAAEVVFLSHMGKIEVSNAVVAVETHEKFSITDRDISWHPVALSFSSYFLQGRASSLEDLSDFIIVHFVEVLVK